MLSAVHDPGGRVLVVSAHPDDEVIAAGAWLSAQEGRDVTFVTATDGEASHPGSPTLGPDDLRRLRPPELRAALAELGHGGAPVHRLGLPDGGLADHAPTLEAAVASAAAGVSLVLATYRHDGHPDHDAVGVAAAAACAGAGIALWELPVWSPVWAGDGEERRRGRTRTLPSTAADRARKARALQAFVTQVRPLGDHPADAAVVGPQLLRRALDEPEVVVV